jgi:DNA-binding protein Fis
MVFDAVSRHTSGVLPMETFRDKIARGIPAQQVIQGSEGCDQIVFPDPLPTLKEAEQMLIAEALKRSDGNQTIAAQMLGLTRRALNNRLSRSRKP